MLICPPGASSPSGIMVEVVESVESQIGDIGRGYKAVVVYQVSMSWGGDGMEMIIINWGG